MSAVIVLALVVVALILAGISIVSSPRSLLAWAVFLLAIVLLLPRV